MDNNTEYPELQALYAQGRFVFAEFDGGSVMRYPFPEQIIVGNVVSCDEQAGVWGIDYGDDCYEDIQAVTTAELLEAASFGLVEYYLGLFTKYRFSFVDKGLNYNKQIRTVRTATVFAANLVDAVKRFNWLHPQAKEVSLISKKEFS